MATYWYISPSHDGWENLALDEWLLDHLNPEDLVVYFYVNQPSVIIGKNQNPWRECNLQAMEEAGVALVRRVTGGGAVYHDQGNLNFSFIAGEDRYDVQAQLGLILEAVNSLGIPCTFTGRNDLLADGRKFSGNAYCQRGKICQHHGTLLLHSDLQQLQRYLTPDPRKMQAKGVSSVRSRVCNLSEFLPGLDAPAMLAAIEAVCRRRWPELAPLSLSPEAQSQVCAYQEKHRSWDWRLGKTPAFDVQLDPRFSWGGVELLLKLEHSAIADAQVYTDALDPELPEMIRQRLLGCPFQKEALKEALSGEDPRLSDLGEAIVQEMPSGL